jgi:hypothetical protein
VAQKELTLACEALEGAELEPAAVTELVVLAHFVVERDF